MRLQVEIRRGSRSLLLLLVPACAVLSQELRGTVVEKDTKYPLASVNVYFHSTKYGTSTDSLGQFAIKNFPSGMYVVEARLVGYKTNRYILTAEKDEIITLLIELQPEPIQLGEVVVTDSLKIRRLATLGKEIITSDEIKQSGTASLSTFLRIRYPGLFPTSFAPGIRRGSFQFLHFILYVDGSLVQYSSDVLDTMLDPDKVNYIEVYRSFGMAPMSNRGSYERVVHIHTKIPELRH